MTKLNNLLLNLFLAFGIVFFLAMIYLFTKNEVLPEIPPNHQIRVSEAKFIKNDIFDKEFSRNISEDSPERNKNRFLLINQTDNTSYTRSNSFDLRLKEAPFSVSFFDSSIPMSVSGDLYKLSLQNEEKTLYEFELEDLNKLLRIKEKPSTATEQREIKLTSTDKKLTLFLIFTID